MEENSTIDLLIVGSETGIATALAGHDKGLKCLIIEKTPYVGGSTALSGGAMETDEHGRVLCKDKSPIEGLYAVGNTAANIFRSVYPGIGGTICQGLVYGYIVAEHTSNLTLLKN
ncbi:FAD-binding protein [Xanthomarina sp. F1114]|uniref:FAD-binding protein n=1 Tax=Xanthomarina sp. F1114 TaxID=2996019 RepID=UPI00225DF748|nr:FAD-binding protein [Xanthomarina sp. F1114]MCX7548963.1 FAD-binding protein [Xanthomarina sp. F1114]